MIRLFSRPVLLVLLLAFCTFIPVMMALVRVVQVPTGTWPDDAARLAVAPFSWGLHAAAGAAFGISGPLQFALALRRRFGRLHRISGRVFVVAGAVLGLSGLSLLAQVTSPDTAVPAVARGVFGVALLATLAMAMAAIHDGDIPRHRAWVIRAYAIGMGSGTVALVYFPIYIATGKPPTGLAADLVFVGWWALNIGLAEGVIHRLSLSRSRITA
jgi:uncharacterized membrane protein